MNAERFLQLTDAHADGTIDPEGFAALQDALRSDHQWRRSYLRIMRGHHQIRAGLQAASGYADAPSTARPFMRMLLRPMLWTALVAVLAVSVAVAIWSSQASAEVVRVDGDAWITSPDGIRPARIGDRVDAGWGLRTGPEGRLVLSLSPATRLDIGPVSAVDQSTSGLDVHEGAAAVSGALAVRLGGRQVHLINGGAILQAAPWAVLLRLNDGATADLPGLRPGGWARRAAGAGWEVHPPEPTALVGEARIKTRHLDHYRSSDRLLVDGNVRGGPPRWSPTADLVLSRARDLGGRIDGLTTADNAIRFPATGATFIRNYLPIGRPAGGMLVRLTFEYQPGPRLPEIEGREGNCFDLAVGMLVAPPFPGAPAARKVQPYRRIEQELQTVIELRVLPVGRLGEDDLSEIGMWTDGTLCLAGWIRGDQVGLTTAYRGGSMTITGIQVAELWETPGANR